MTKQKVALLSAEEEVALARTIEAGVLADAVLGGHLDGADATAAELAALVEAGNRAWQHMWLANEGLVGLIARQWSQRTGLPLEELRQDGHLGLAESIMRFDHRRGARFSTVAWRWVGYRVRLCADRLLGARRELAPTTDFGLDQWLADDHSPARIDQVEGRERPWADELTHDEWRLVVHTSEQGPAALDRLEVELGVSRSTLYRMRRRATQRALELHLRATLAGCSELVASS